MKTVKKQKVVDAKLIFSTYSKEVPILSFGYPQAEEDDDEDDESLVISSLIKQGQSPFKVLSASLYNVDYNNRIIVIDEQIDERCFVYAKMIENWNRVDRETIALKKRVINFVDVHPDVKELFTGFIFSDEEITDLDVVKENVKEKVESLLEKYPEVGAILATIQDLGISQFDILNYEPTPIRIKFNSPGGWLLAYQTLADVIALSKTKVMGINMGMAYSAAAFLLIACHERLALPKSRMMVHRGSGGNWGSFEQTESSQKNYKEEVDEMIEAFKRKTKIPMKVLREKMNPDWYLSAQMALKYGMIDRIVTDINEII